MRESRRFPERRDTSPAGVWNREQFEASLGLLHALGLPHGVIEHYRELARETGRLPHEFVADLVREAVSSGSGDGGRGQGDR
ncbi:MAG TPA: hypothetical protein VFL28_07400 [bacterium]|nr:hypothetical protein [bacterium]